MTVAELDHLADIAERGHPDRWVFGTPYWRPYDPMFEAAWLGLTFDDAHQFAHLVNERRAALCG